MQFSLICGNSLERLKDLKDNSVDSVITDPPYEINFMSKGWDNSGIAFNTTLWKEVFRVLKPGGHLISFSGSRTYHRMTVAIEDAGFEIRDQIIYMYGNGFPKGQNIGKGIDKKLGATRKVIGKAVRPVKGTNLHCGEEGYGRKDEYDLTEPATEEAKEWEGWNTSLKPAHEPMVLARKPISENTIADNVLKHRTGAINIEGCRVGGRYPANLIHDGSEEVLSVFPNTAPSKAAPRGAMGKSPFSGLMESGTDNTNEVRGHNDNGGSASRYFYCAKASKNDRNEGLEGHKTQNNHPTVKNTDLMSYLCRLITPPGGTVLDPFNGSGSTGKACAREGFNYIGIDLSQDYIDISRLRIEHELKKWRIKKAPNGA